MTRKNEDDLISRQALYEALNGITAEDGRIDAAQVLQVVERMRPGTHRIWRQSEGRKTTNVIALSAEERERMEQHVRSYMYQIYAKRGPEAGSIMVLRFLHERDKATMDELDDMQLIAYTDYLKRYI